MTVDEAIRALQALHADGHGDLPLQLMSVEQGVTVALDLSSFMKSLPYDGERIWVMHEAWNMPEWMSTVLLNVPEAEEQAEAERLKRTHGQWDKTHMDSPTPPHSLSESLPNDPFDT